MKLSDAEILFEIQRRSYSLAGPAITSTWPETSALDTAGLRVFLERHRYAVLATGRRDGRPQAAPVGFLVLNGAFWIATIAGGRLRNVRDVPWASLVVMEDEATESGGRAHAALRVEGPVRIHKGEALDAPRRLLEGVWRERYGEALDWAVAILKIDPDRLFSYSQSRSPEMRRA